MKFFEKSHLHVRKMTKLQKCSFYKKLHFSHFQKNYTIEKSDINALKSSSNQKIATNACINSANFTFSAKTHLEILSKISLVFSKHHHLNTKS